MNKPVNFNDSRASATTVRIVSAAPEESIEPELGALSEPAQPEISSANAAGRSPPDDIEGRASRLASMDLAEYERVRKEVARELNLRLGTLDRLVDEARRGHHHEHGDGSEYNEDPAERTMSQVVHVDGVPPDFILTDDGVFWRDPTERTSKPVRVCAPLRVSALVRDVASNNWGRVLEFADADGVPHKWVMPMTVSVGDGVDLCRELVRQGLEIAAGSRARGMLVQYVASCRPRDRGRCVQKTGWFQNVFVLPDRTLGTGTESVLYQSESGNAHYAQRGDLDEWKYRVGRLCVGNSRLLLSVCAAFSGPLLHLAGHDSGGIHFVGPSSIGKTTLLSLSGSVFGGPGFIRTWRATCNGLEGLCELHNDTLLVLDEMGEVDPKEAGSIAYMIGNGVGKTRADRNGEARSKKTWRLIFISSGEVGLAQHMIEGGKVARTGQEVRLIDLPADAGVGHGVFENLHGFEHGGALSNALREASRQCYGVAGVTFIEAASKDHASLPSVLRSRIDHFVDMYLPNGAGGQATRVCFRFAIIAAAGEMASVYGVTGWERGTATEAAATCFQAWLDQRGGAGNSEREKILAAVRAFFETHGDARFTELTVQSERVTTNRVGFRKAGVGGEEFYVLPEAYKRDVCAGFDQRTVTRVLLDAGWLQPGKDQKSAQKKSLPGLGETRVYVVTAAMWRSSDPN